MAGIVYVLKNAAMPRLLKIGKTDDIMNRMRELYDTGVPFPFKCLLAIKVEDKEDVEKKLHDAFEDDRPNKKREFFAVEISQVIKKLKELGVEYEDITPADNDCIFQAFCLEELAAAHEWYTKVT